MTDLYDDTIGKILRTVEHLRDPDKTTEFTPEVQAALANLFEETALRMYEMYRHITDGAFEEETFDLWYQDFFTIANLILTESADADIIVELDEQKEEHDDAGTAQGV